jgi:hypothetical protein
MRFKNLLSIIFTAIIVFGVAIATQSVFGINIGSNLDLGSIRRITNLPVPVAGGEAANKDYVDSAASPPIPTGLYGTCNHVHVAGCNPCNSAAPAACSNAGPGPCDFVCQCPAGYSIRGTGTQVFGGGTREYFSCYKL